MIITAVFSSEDEARGAITEAQRDGIDVGKIGVKAGDVVLPTDKATRRRVAEGRVARWVLVNLLGWGFGGAALGALLALVVTVAMGATRAAVDGAMVAMALGGAGLAILVAALMSIGVGQPWEATFEEDGGPLRVIITTTDDDEIRRARAALQSAGARYPVGRSQRGRVGPVRARPGPSAHRRRAVGA